MPQAGVAFDLASFKNSREYARKATTTAITVDSSVLVAATLLQAADPNRTYITLRNLNSSLSFPAGVTGLKYYYQHAGDPAPLAATILADGFELDPGEAVDLESPEAIWAASMGGVPVPVSMDIGSG